MSVEPNPTLISIVIPTLGRDSLLRTLASIRGNRDHIEIVVCSDVRADRSNLQKISAEKLVTSPGSGVNRARNEGARQSHGEIIWFLDDDTEIFYSGAVEKLRDLFRDSSIIAAGGEYLSDGESRLTERGYNAFCSVWRTSAGQENRELLLGGTLAVRRTSFDDAGGFDECIEYGGAETSFVQRLNARAAADQRVVFSEDLNVTHRPSSRGISGWIRVAIAQGRRKRDTASALPPLNKRICRAVEAIRRQNFRTQISFVVFTIPFIAISRVILLSRR